MIMQKSVTLYNLASRGITHREKSTVDSLTENRILYYETYPSGNNPFPPDSYRNLV